MQVPSLETEACGGHNGSNLPAVIWEQERGGGQSSERWLTGLWTAARS